MLALGANEKRDKNYDRDMRIADEIAYTCYMMYKNSKSGLSPETVTISKDGKMMKEAAYNILRPEAIESIFYLYYYTRNEKYREWGWEMFDGFIKNSKSKFGFTSLYDADSPSSRDDKQESFWIAETLKYFYLLFNPKIDLNNYVLTTEGHILEKFN